MPYYEVWIDLARKEEVERRLREVCREVHEAFYDYHFIVEAEDEKDLSLEGVIRVRRHYNC